MFKDFQVKTISKGVSGACKFIKKETLAHAFSCEFCELFKNTFLYRTPPMTAPDNAIFTIEPMKQINKHDFLVRCLCFIETERQRTLLF